MSRSASPLSIAASMVGVLSTVDNAVCTRSAARYSVQVNAKANSIRAYGSWVVSRTVVVAPTASAGE